MLTIQTKLPFKAGIKQMWSRANCRQYPENADTAVELIIAIKELTQVKIKSTMAFL